MAEAADLQRWASLYVEGLRDVKAEQPMLTRLRSERQSAERYLLEHIPFGSDAREYTQDGQRWVMKSISTQKPPLSSDIERRMTTHFSDAEKKIIRESHNMKRIELRVITSIDYEGLDEPFAEGDNTRDDFYDIGEALYKYRKAAYETRAQQHLVSVARSQMRVYEKLLKRDAPSDFKIDVDGVTVEVDRRYMGMTMGGLRQHLLQGGLSRQKVELYLAMRRRPLWERRVSSVMLTINGILQNEDVFGVYHRPNRHAGRDIIVIDDD